MQNISKLTGFALAIACTVLGPISAAAQQPAVPPFQPQPADSIARAHDVAISANPFGLLLELFNAEVEVALSNYTTAGIGGSTYNGSDDDYINGDLFVRYYPQGEVYDGWAFGVKLGVTNLPDDGSYFGLGFDANRSWLLGRNDAFYVGIGFGLKRLYGVPEDVEPTLIPTIRLINVGVAF